MSDPTDDMTFIEMGVHFGYPECCIRARVMFAIRVQHGDRTAIAESQRDIAAKANLPWFGTGFVPCAACEAVIGDSPDRFKEFVAVVITPNRACPHPFPTDYRGKP